ncbi:hypothetical protein BpHYR1_002844 [Brachionus plicatilis]|uniref:Uncharacterized protein n=1 Tax=Brachionus plicatilis TaxID=10195 RepID=A0A3M7P459_BRAPC|nr:hypothetical protein BpHYR1_002844 [Brachionus plicatilis]
MQHSPLKCVGRSLNNIFAVSRNFACSSKNPFIIFDHMSGNVVLEFQLITINMDVRKNMLKN